MNIFIGIIIGLVFGFLLSHPYKRKRIKDLKHRVNYFERTIEKLNNNIAALELNCKHDYYDEYSRGMDEGIRLAHQERFGEHFDRFMAEIHMILTHEKLSYNASKNIIELKDRFGSLQIFKD